MKDLIIRSKGAVCCGTDNVWCPMSFDAANNTCEYCNTCCAWFREQWENRNKAIKLAFCGDKCIGVIVDVQLDTQQPPEPPRMDERDKSAELGPCTTWTPDNQSEGFDGTETNPVPLGGKVGSTTIIEAIVETLPFMTVIAIANILKVPHNYTEWLDDDFPDKKDELRVAVAEAMEKVGK